MNATASNKLALRNALEAHARGEIEPMRALLDQDFISEIHGPAELFRWAGHREGITNAIATVSEIATEYTIHSHRIVEFVEEGEIVWVRGILDVSSHKTLRQATFPLAGRWCFRDGKALSAEWYFDSAMLASKLGLEDRAR